MLFPKLRHIFVCVFTRGEEQLPAAIAEFANGSLKSYRDADSVGTSAEPMTLGVIESNACLAQPLPTVVQRFEENNRKRRGRWVSLPDIVECFSASGKGRTDGHILVDSSEEERSAVSKDGVRSVPSLGTSSRRAQKRAPQDEVTPI